ncbi:MAG: branched-chain amino acid ABC transporter substrate-binding protein, partial [Chloroflexota bacterium]
MRNRRALALFAVVVLIVGAAGLVLRMRPVPGAVQVGVVLPLDSEVGVQMLQAIEMALADWQPTDDDLTVELVPVSYSAETSEERMRLHREAMVDFGADDRVIGVIGAPNTAFATDVIALTNRANLPVISPAATWAGLTKSGYRAGEPGIYYPTGTRTFFRTIPADDIQGLAALEWFRREGITRIFVLTLADNVYSTGLGGILVANAEDFGVTVVEQATYNVEADDADRAAQHADLATRVQQADVQAVFYPAVVPVGAYAIVNPIREANPDVIIFGTEGLPSATDDIGMDMTDAGRLYATSLVPDPARLPAAQDFIAAYEERYGAPPVPFAITAHDAMVAVLTALE